MNRIIEFVVLCFVALNISLVNQCIAAIQEFDVNLTSTKKLKVKIVCPPKELCNFQVLDGDKIIQFQELGGTKIEEFTRNGIDRNYFKFSCLKNGEEQFLIRVKKITSSSIFYFRWASEKNRFNPVFNSELDPSVIVQLGSKVFITDDYDLAIATGNQMTGWKFNSSKCYYSKYGPLKK